MGSCLEGRRCLVTCMCKKSLCVAWPGRSVRVIVTGCCERLVHLMYQGGRGNET